MARLSELEAQKSDIKVKIAREEIKSAVLSKEQILFWLNKMKDSDILNEDNRERIVDTFINSIYVYDDKVVINYNCREDSETILPDNMGESSYLRIVGEPKQKHTNRFDNMRLYGNQKASGITSRRFYFSLNKKSPAFKREREKIFTSP